MSFLRQHPADEEYMPCVRLSGTEGPINTLAFGPDAKFLASGGDDQKLRIWDVSRKQIHQIIGDDLERWGQITCAKWLFGCSDQGDTLCFGTGRGLVLIYQRSREADQFKELSSTAAFAFSEPVEAMDYDSNKSRLVISSHNGKIKLFHAEKNGTLLKLWIKNWNEIQEARGVIPQAVCFTEKGENLVIFGLESGVMLSKVTATGIDNWSKVLKSSIGNVCLSANHKWLLVDNLTKGFDLYAYPHTSPLESFPVPRTKAFVQQGIFLENGMSVACGSDHGYIHIFSRGTSACLQKLKHGSAKTRIQVLDSYSTSNQHLIASGTDEKNPVIHIWAKKVQGGPQDQQRTNGCSSTTILVFLNILFILSIASIAALWMVENWSHDWLNSPAVAVPVRYRSAQEVPDNAEDLLKRNGIDLNDPNWRHNV